jgi:hypothetical protein
MAFDPISVAIQLAISTILSFALAPKPPKIDPSNLNDLDFPTAKEGDPLGVVFGRVWSKSPNTLWAGDFQATAIKGPRRYGFFGPRVTIGYNYTLGLHMSVSHGALDAYHNLKYGTDQFPITSGNNSVSTEKFTSEFTCYDGTVGQDADPYLVSKITSGEWPLTFGARESGLRGLAHVVFKGAQLGKSPQLRPMSFEVSRIPQRVFVNPTLYFDNFQEDETGVTGVSPAAIIYEVLRNGEWGLGELAENIDIDTFQAAHLKLVEEEFWMNLFWAKDSSIEDLITLVLNHIDGWVYIDRTTGKFVLRLNRRDFNLLDVPELEENDVISWGNLGRPSAEEAANTIVLTYNNKIDGASATITETNLAARQRQGRQTFDNLQYPGISSEALARTIARREVRKRSLALLNGKIDVPFTTALQFQPGDPVYVYSPRRGIAKTLCRVQSIELGTSGFEGKATLQLVQDTSLEATLATAEGFDNPGSPFGVSLQPVQNEEAVELPYSPAVWALQNGVSVETFDTSETTVAGSAFFTPFSGANGALSVYSKIDGGDLFEELSPDPRALTNAPVLASPENTSFTVDNVVGALSDLIGQICLLGDEWVRVNSVAGSTLTVQRGFLDSVPLAHTVGTRITALTLGEVASFGAAPARFRLLSEFRGDFLPEAQATLLSVPNTRRAARPYPAANLRVDGSRNPSTRTGPVTISWVNRDRTTESPSSPVGYTSTLSRTEPGITNTLRIYGGASSAGPFTTLLLQENLGVATSYAWDGAFTGWARAEVVVTRNGLSNRHQFPITWEQLE